MTDVFILIFVIIPMWSKDDFYKNDYNEIYNFDTKFNNFDTKFNNFDIKMNVDNEPAPSDTDHFDFNSPRGFGNIFFLMIGGLVLFIILVTLFKYCCKKNGPTTATTATTVGRHNHNYRSALSINHFTSIDYGPTDDIITYYNDEERVEPAQLDLPPSYDVSTANSRCNSTHDLHDSGNHCNVPDTTTQNDVAPPSYSEVCESDYNVE